MSSTAYPQATPKSADEITHDNLAVIMSCVALTIFGAIIIGVWYGIYGRNVINRRRYVDPQQPSSPAPSLPKDVETGIIGPHQEDGSRWAVSTIESLNEAADREAKQSR